MEGHNNIILVLTATEDKTTCMQRNQDNKIITHHPMTTP